MPAQYTRYNIQHTSSGYTLIEVLVGLVIVGFMFNFGYASFRDFSRREALSGIVKQIQGDIRLAQGLASAGEKPDASKTNHSYCDSPNLLDSYAIVVSAINSNYSIQAYCTGNVAPVNIKTVSLPSEITVANPSPNPIKFKVLGQGTNIAGGSSAILTLTQKGTHTTATITITSGGEIK